MKAIIKKVDEQIEIKEFDKIRYEDLKGVVNGWIEAVSLDKGVTCWMNEEAKLIGLQRNFSIGGISIEGDVIFTSIDEEGDTVGLDDEQIEYIKSIFNKKATEFEKWIDTFFDEKDLELKIWTYSEGNLIANIDNKSVIAELRNVRNKDSQSQILDTLVMMDFLNRDVNDYLKFIADQMFEHMKKTNPFYEEAR